MDAKVGSATFRNTGTTKAPAFIEDSAFSKAFLPQRTSEVRVDIDADGDVDLVTGKEDGTISVSRRNGPALNVTAKSDNPFAGFRFSGAPNLSFVDIDGDDDMDLFAGDQSHRIFYFENLSHQPQGADVDGDGLPDAWEIHHFGGTDFSDAQADVDGDSLTNLKELAYGIHPGEVDTDGDGTLDAAEFNNGTLPLIVTVPYSPTTVIAEGASLKILEVTAATIRLEAYFSSKTPFELWHSLDLVQWSPLEVSLNGDDEGRQIVLPRSMARTPEYYRLQLP